MESALTMELIVPNSPELKTIILPPPIGGLNKRDPLHAMPNTDASTLDNWVPDNSNVRLRYGSSLFATIPSGGEVVALQSVFVSAGRIDYLLASDNSTNDLYYSDQVGTVVRLTTGAFATENTFMCTHNQTIYVKARSVAETYQYYTPGPGTITSAAFTNGAFYYGMGSFKGSIYLPGYSGVALPSFGYGSIGGVATMTITNFDLSQVSREGGEVLFCGSTTRAKSAAEDALFVAVTNRGEIFAYQGSHPSSPTWSLVGIYKIPRPFGYKSFFYLGAHLYIWTVGGIISMASILNDQQVNGKYNSISDKIDPIFADLATATNLSVDSNFPTVNSRFAAAVDYIGNTLYLIAPDDYIYAMNLKTNAWYRISGWPAYSIAVANNKVYIGSTNGKIIQIADSAASGDYNPATGATDSIATSMRTAYNYLDNPSLKKQMMGVKVFSEYKTGFTMTVDADMDYANSTPSSTTAEGSAAGATAYSTFCGMNGKLGHAVAISQSDSYAATKSAKINAFQVYYKEAQLTI